MIADNDCGLDMTCQHESVYVLRLLYFKIGLRTQDVTHVMPQHDAPHQFAT